LVLRGSPASISRAYRTLSKDGIRQSAGSMLE
jgi:hypothetical protein